MVCTIVVATGVPKLSPQIYEGNNAWSNREIEELISVFCQTHPTLIGSRCVLRAKCDDLVIVALEAPPGPCNSVSPSFIKTCQLSSSCYYLICVKRNVLATSIGAVDTMFDSITLARRRIADLLTAVSAPAIATKPRKTVVAKRSTMTSDAF